MLICDCTILSCIRGPKNKPYHPLKKWTAPSVTGLFIDRWPWRVSYLVRRSPLPLTIQERKNAPAHSTIAVGEYVTLTCSHDSNYYCGGVAVWCVLFWWSDQRVRILEVLWLDLDNKLLSYVWFCHLICQYWVCKSNLILINSYKSTINDTTA